MRMLNYFRSLFAARRAAPAAPAPAAAVAPAPAPAADPLPVAPGKRRRRKKAQRRQPAQGTRRLDPNQPLFPQMKDGRDAWM